MNRQTHQRRIKTIAIVSVAMVLIWVIAFGAQKTPSTTPPSADSAVVPADSVGAVVDNPIGGTVIAYYFHGTQRCATCLKLEAYTQEALETGFESELADTLLIWRTVDYDEEDNEHYIKDYKLFTKSVILSRVVDGEEVGWRNLDKIWRLVNSKDKFVTYIQEETRAFIKGDEEADEDGGEDEVVDE